MGPSTIGAVIAISVGASLGAVLRWVLGMRLNAMFPAIPMGTLASNLIGGYIVGVAIAYFATRPDLPREWRLFLITGFCGGLTTFSTFSAEVVDALQRGAFAAGISTIALHVGGSLCMTLLGLATWQWIASN
jgi:CrcB protein